MEYNSEIELYKAMQGAFKVKMRMLQNKYDNITEKDIWNYLKFNKWRQSISLTEADMVNDIIDVDANLVIDYINKNKKEGE